MLSSPQGGGAGDQVSTEEPCQLLNEVLKVSLPFSGSTSVNVPGKVMPTTMLPWGQTPREMPCQSSALRQNTTHGLSTGDIHTVGTGLVGWLEIPHNGEALNALSKEKRRNHTNLRAIPADALSS